MNLPPDLRLNEMENRFATYTAQIKSLDTMFNNQLNMLQSQVGDLEREIGGLVETINAGLDLLFLTIYGFIEAVTELA